MAAQSGADAIGLVFHEASARHVTIEQACSIVSVLPPFVSIVALFVDAPEVTVRKVIEQVPVTLLQFHGNEKPYECERYGKPYIKAVHMKKDVDLVQAEEQFERAQALLLDTYLPAEQAPGEQVPGEQAPAEYGGTGKCFDWGLVSHNRHKPIILAGGLNAENVAAAISKVKPYAVDVSSGVEASKGIKDADKIKAFIQAVEKPQI